MQSEINSNVNAMDGFISELENNMQTLFNEMEASCTWWTGSVGDATREEYRELHNAEDRVVDKLEYLKSVLSQLSSQIGRADDERRRKRLEALRLKQLEAIEMRAE